MNSVAENSLAKIASQLKETNKHGAYGAFFNLEKEPGKHIYEAGMDYRADFERWQFLSEILNFDDKHILDIGANSGYFSLSALKHGAKAVDAYEGDKDFFQMLKIQMQTLFPSKDTDLQDCYFDLQAAKNCHKHYDISFLLNVVHHLGDDFQSETVNIESAKRSMLDYINSFASLTDYVVLQIGFIWKGNPKLPLFKTGSKKEMIDFIVCGTSKYFDLYKVGVAVQKEDSTIQYIGSDSADLSRNSNFREFLNRPILILKRKDI